MPCAVASCLVDDPTVATEPCNSCGKPTHHMCSNYVHESELNERWCSIQCVLNLRPDIGDMIIRGLSQGSSSAVSSSAAGPGSMEHILKTMTPRVERDTAKESLKAFVKTYKSKGKAKKLPTGGKPLPNTPMKRKSVLADLRKSYIGKILEISGEVTGTKDDKIMYKFHVTELNRRKLKGSSKMEPVLNLICENNPAMIMQEVPLASLKARLDLAPFDERRILTFEVDDGMLEALIEEKKKKRKKHVPREERIAASTPIPEVPDDTSEIPEENHEYSDEEEDMDESIVGVNTLLDVLESTRVGLYSNDIEPQIKVVQDDTAHANKIDLDNMQWTRCDFSDVKDDPLAFNSQTKVTSEALCARESPLSIFLLLAPHSLWEHVARCSEMKRRVLLKKMSSTEGRKDMKYIRSLYEATSDGYQRCRDYNVKSKGFDKFGQVHSSKNV